MRKIAKICHHCQMIRHIFAIGLVLTVLLVGQLSDARPTPEIISVNQIYANGQLYSIAVVGYSNAIWRSIPGGLRAGQKAASVMIRQARRWATKQYKLRYPQIETSFFDTLEEKDPIFDEQSTTIIVYKGMDRSRIVGTLRVAYATDAHPQLPSERIFDFNFPEIETILRPYPNRHVFQDSTLGRSAESWPMLLSGGTRELKQLIVDQNETVDIIPMLVFFGEDSTETYFNQALWAEHIQAEHSGIGFNPKDYVYPWNYVLTCDGLMIPYYRRLGFHLVSDTPIKDNNFALTMTRPEFLENLYQKRMRARPGYQLLVDAKRENRSGPEIQAQFIARFGAQYRRELTQDLGKCGVILSEIDVDIETLVQPR